jgi:tetratricopeptide (TPR) repeat protein
MSVVEEINTVHEPVQEEIPDIDSSDSDEESLEQLSASTIMPLYHTNVVVTVGNADSSAVPAHHHNKIILNLMIKNESKIIERCIGNSIDYVDAVNILDTGSTDNTVEVCKAYLTASGKPFRISVHPFKTFGHNRSISFDEAQKLCEALHWNAEECYAMAVDADMVIKATPAFKDFKMTQNGYRMIQQHGSLKYYNVRFLKCSYAWKCIGSTHEYWSGEPSDNVPAEVCYIDDIGDGGCKSDKNERDIRLLTEEVRDQPNNGRAHFYLAQSYKDGGQVEKAIPLFKRRIEIGGWYEEVWYSHYMLGKCYDMLHDEHNMELWMNKGFEMHPHRAENLYYLVHYFRVKGQYYKAYHYYLKGKDIPYPKNDMLFIEGNIYDGMFSYENTVIACYISGKTKQDSLCDLVSYINQKIPYHIDNVWDNLHYYTQPLIDSTYKGEYSSMLLKDHEEYKISSCSIQPYSATDPIRRYIMNTRFVNYDIDHNGSYHMRSPDGHVKTMNGRLFLNASFQPTEGIRMMNEDYVRSPSHIEGMEDVRLFYHENKLRFTASCKNITNDGKIVIATGDYVVEENMMKNIRVLEPPTPSLCEKNWVYVSPRYLESEKAKGRMNFIYGWNPLVIGSVQENQLEIHTTYETPALFNRFRGSSAVVEYQQKLYAVIHFVKYSTPRCYYHSVVQFNRDTMKPEAYAAPFTFCEPKIEYCLGLEIQNGFAHFFFSRNDTSPSTICLPFENLRMIPL